MSEQQSNGFGGNKNTRRFDDRGTRRPDFGGQGGRDFRRGGGRDGGQAEMFKATCADCHKPCEVPFRPSGDKPVYCKECFMKRRDNSPRAEGRDFQKRGASSAFSPAPQGAGVRLDDLKRQMDAMNAKLDIVVARMGGAHSQAGAAKGGKTSSAKRGTKKPRKAAKK